MVKINQAINKMLKGRKATFKPSPIAARLMMRTILLRPAATELDTRVAVLCNYLVIT